MTIWTGWDLASGASRESVTDLVDRSGDSDAETAYELLAIAGRGFRPPGFLTVRATDGSSTPGIPDDAAGPVGLRRAWTLAYRQLAETAQPGSPPYAIYLLGVDPPPGATESELATFNDFYTNVHLVEVAERRHALRAVRYELERVIEAPPKGAPRFLAVYEVDEAAASQRRHVGPPYQRGPAIWQGHTTPWRIWFRRLAR